MRYVERVFLITCLFYFSSNAVVDLDHPEYKTRLCNETAMKALCFRNCTTKPRVVQYKGIGMIRSPTYNDSMFKYNLKQLSKIYHIGRLLMDATEKTPLFDLVTKIIKDKMLVPPLKRNTILDIVELQLYWFLVILFGIAIVVFLTIFVTFSMLDGVFGWTSSIKRQQRLPSNAMWVNCHGISIGLSTVVVLLGCLLAWVGNLLVTENKYQAQVQGLKDYGWSQNYSLSGRLQFKLLIDQFTEQLLPEIRMLYDESILTASINIKKNTKGSEGTYMNCALTLNIYLNKLAKINELNEAVSKSVGVIAEVAPEALACLELLPTMILIYCDGEGHATDMVKCFPTDSGHEIKDGKKSFKPKLYLKIPNVQMINGTVANVSMIDSEALANATAKINLAIAAKLYEAAEAGDKRWTTIYNVLWTRSKSWRQAYYLLLEQTAKVAQSQYIALMDMQVQSLRSLLRGKQYINYFLSDESNVSKINQLRYNVFAYVIVVAAFTVCVGMIAWCVGCCNFNEKQWPMQREGISHIAGQVLYYSSYVALFLSLFTLTCGVLYFIPTSLFNFSCDVFRDSKKNFFMLYDEEVIVKEQILGTYIHENPDVNLTFDYFMKMCEKDESIYRALKLDQRWDLTEIFQINETMDVIDHMSLLKKINFKDQYLMMPPKVIILTELKESMDDLEFSDIKFQINSSTHLFGADWDNSSLTTWMANFKVFDKYMSKYGEKIADGATNKAEYTKYTETCHKYILDDKTGWMKDSDNLEAYLKPFDTLFAGLEQDVISTKSWAIKTVRQHLKAEKEFLEDIGPLTLNETMDTYTELIMEELDCFIFTAGGQVEFELGQCRTLFDIYNGTMYYFCQFLVGPMTITWLSMFMVGFALTIYIQLARAVSMYFLTMDEIHPDDVTQEDRIRAIQEE